MPSADNQGVCIHFAVEGKGPPLVLLHGFGGSSAHWHQMGYVEALKTDYRMILIDARGHGASDKPHDPDAYKMALRVSDVIAVLDGLGIDKAHLFGYSMGGWIGWAILKHARERFHSLIIGGASPREKTQQEINFFLGILRQGNGAWLAANTSMFGTRWTAELEAIAQSSDLEALIALFSMEERLGFEDMLTSITLPCLLFAGENAEEYSAVRECAERMPGAIFASLPDVNHVEGICRIDLVLPHITRFLAKTRQS